MRDSSKLPGARADGPPKMAVQMVKFLVLPVVFLALLTLMLRQPQRFRWVPDPTVVVSLGFWRGANTGGGSSEDRVDGFTVGPSHYDVLLRTKYQVELLRSLESSLGVEQVARLKEDIMLQAAGAWECACASHTWKILVLCECVHTHTHAHRYVHVCTEKSTTLQNS